LGYAGAERLHNPIAGLSPLPFLGEGMGVGDFKKALILGKNNIDLVSI
jgi:hypothetical protein